MADDVDRAQRHIEAEDRARNEAIRKAAQIPAGKAGDCDLCGSHSMRLVGGACAPCRDRYGLE